jgi:predicted NBD/HSP70 family sugar kinase
VRGRGGFARSKTVRRVMNAVGVDVGGTKIAAGVVSPEGRLLNEVTYPTANAQKRLLSTIAEARSRRSREDTR